MISNVGSSLVLNRATSSWAGLSSPVEISSIKKKFYKVQLSLFGNCNISARGPWVLIDVSSTSQINTYKGRNLEWVADIKREKEMAPISLPSWMPLPL